MKLSEMKPREIRRREFLTSAAYGISAAWLGTKMTASAFALPELTKKFTASDTVVLGNTGIHTSRLAMGTGTNGTGHQSRQTALGVKGLSNLLLNGYDDGLRFFDSADAYGSHPHVAEALKHIPRDKVTVLTKSWSRDPAEMRADLDRFRKELGTDYLDIADALPDRRRLDRALQGRNGRALRSQTEGDHSRTRLLVPLD